MELGAGSGALAAGMLDALAAGGASLAHYRILEVSPDLRERQRGAMTARASARAVRLEWLDRIPDAIDGVVIMNEVLDAVPPHVVVRRGGRWFERGVAWNEGLRWEDRPLAPGALLDLAQARFPPQGDYASEINRAAEALVETLARRVRSGGLLLIDYGFPQTEYYHPQRSSGHLDGALSPSRARRPVPVAGSVRPHRARRFHGHGAGGGARRTPGRGLRAAGRLPGLGRHPPAPAAVGDPASPDYIRKPPRCSACCRRRKWASCSKSWYWPEAMVLLRRISL